jgi:hypothetical protein
MNQRVERHHRVYAGGRQLEVCHVGLDQARSRDEPARPAELDGGEIYSDDPQPVVVEVAGGRYPCAATEVQYLGRGRQQAGKIGYPARVTAGVLRRRPVRFAVIAAVRLGDRVVSAPDKVALPRPGSAIVVQRSIVPHKPILPDIVTLGQDRHSEIGPGPA